MWNADRGFGFIGDDAGGPDVFLHVSALQSAGIDPDDIRKGERLTFDIESGREGKTHASNVRRPNGPFAARAEGAEKGTVAFLMARRFVGYRTSKLRSLWRV
jgi:CspA family cold shock protein